MVARTCIIALAIVAAVVFTMSYLWHQSPASQIPPIRTGDDTATVTFQNEVEQAYESKGADYMESLADSLRKNESRVSGGNTKLFELYNVLADIRCGCRDGTRMVHSFEDRRARLREWLDKYPHSTTATLAMAVLWEHRSRQIAYGFDNVQRNDAERGDGFREARRNAASYIEKLKVTDDPYVAFFALRQQRYSGATRDDAQRLFEAGTAAWPRHYQIYFLYFQSMDPVLGWNSDREGQRRLLDDLSAATSDEDKQVGLAFIAGARYQGGRFDGSGVSWEAVKNAYEVRRKLYGWRNRDLNVICYLAIQAEDWDAAKAYMREINGRWDDLVWKSQNDFVWNELIVSLH
jgi:hypothetical protein